MARRFATVLFPLTAVVLLAAGCSDADDMGGTNPPAAVIVHGSGGDGADAAQGVGGGAGNHADGSVAAGGLGGSNAGTGGSPAGGSGGRTSGAGGLGTGGSPGGAGTSGTGGKLPDASVPSTCLADIRALGVAFVETEARGVVDAVELTAPLNGVLIANGTGTDPASDPMACEFVKTLLDFTDLLKARGFDRVGTLGSYCYRCCCAWSSTNFCRGPDDPEPDCSADGYSNHSWGRAIDIRYYYKADGTRYDIEDPAQWVQWTGAGDTCMDALVAQTGISRELYELMCEASSQRLFTTVLTPNYNAAHRNHTHLDIGDSGPASGFFIRSFGLPNVDSPERGDE